MKLNLKLIVIVFSSFLASCASQIPLGDYDSLTKDKIESSPAVKKEDSESSERPVRPELLFQGRKQFSREDLQKPIYD